MPELNDERYVRELFADLYGVELRKVPQSNTKNGDHEAQHDEEDEGDDPAD